MHSMRLTSGNAAVRSPVGSRSHFVRACAGMSQTFCWNMDVTNL
jgi:hypothetical protein